MKKIVSIMLAAIMAVGLTACAQKPGTQGKTTEKETNTEDETGGDGKYELALITDVGTIDDKSFNQGSWEGLKKYADENKISCKYYKPTEKSDKACMTAIDLAVKGGAKVIVTPGFLFEKPIYQAQTKYPDITFILIDAAPADGENKNIEKNVLSVFYAEEQAGYLAGYAAVVEGYHKLGFMGGIAVPAVMRFGYGFVQGADAAAGELGFAKGEVSVKYTYVGNFEASPENNAKAAAWYNEGVQCIFACGGGVGNSVMKAAETAGAVVIGVDVDQSAESATVITSAMKNLGDSVYDAVSDYYAGTFEGGRSVTLDATVDGIRLPMATSKFKTFEKTQYDKLYAGLKDGTIKVAGDTAAKDASELPTEVVTVDSVK